MNKEDGSWRGRRDADGPPSQDAASADPAKDGRPRRKRHGLLRIVKWAFLACLAVCVIAAAGVAAINAGALDGVLRARVQNALQRALGSDLEATVGGTGIRLASTGRIEMHAGGVRIVDRDTQHRVAMARSIDFDLAPRALVRGEIDVGTLVVDGVTLDPGAFGNGEPGLDIEDIRVDALGSTMDAVFSAADRLLAVLDAGHAGTIRVIDTQIVPGSSDAPPITVKTLNMQRDGGGIRLDGVIDEAGTTARLTATAAADASRASIRSLRLSLEGFDTAPFLIQKAGDGKPAVGVAAKADVSVSAVRAAPGRKPALNAAIQLAPGTFYADGTPAEIRSGHVDLDYDFAKRSITIKPSEVKVGRSSFPFSGGIIDLSSLPDQSENGFAFELISNSAVSAPEDSEEPSLPFSGKIFAKYLKDQKELTVEQMAISTPVGALAGSLQVVFAGKSPEISFVATIDSMRTQAIKQLWPYWLAVHARDWVLNNLYGGDVTNASIKLFIPKDEIAENAGNLRFGPDQLQVGFDYTGARLNIAGDIPPLRSAKGHLSLKGTRLTIALAGGTAYFPSGRSVSTADGSFTIPDTDRHPLMADLDIVVSGKADAVAELVSYDPINALQRTDYKPEDFDGDVVSHVRATFGLIRQQHPPKPVWKVDATLKDVDLAPAVDGHAFHKLQGSLEVDPDKAVLDTDAEVDGFPMHVALTEPFDRDSPVKRQRVISARLGDAARKALLPGLETILDGPVDMRMTRTGDGTQDLTADLSDATVHVPGLGWTKAPGVAATATFSTEDRDDTITIDDFDLSGKGFSVAGSLRIADNTLASAHFSNVRLSGSDRFAVDVERSGNGYAIRLDGDAVDLRGLIKSIKGDGGLAQDGGVPLDITAKAKTAYGFHQQTVSALTLKYSGEGSRIDSLDARAVTGSGRALVASVSPADSGTELKLTCGDAGALARFADIYAKLDGGLLNVRLHKAPGEPYRGSLDLRDFSIRNEERLKTIIESKTGSGGMSLRQRAEKPIDAATPSFERAFANVELGSDTLKVSDGILRGAQIGSSFQGTVFDQNGNMNVTGTFMPAYGVNRLFADVPIVGALLGNGRDRGLIGITYRLTGKVSSPKVEVNPLSLIAPGIFRQIFEY